MFRDPELPKTLLPSYRRGFKKIEPFIAPRRIIPMDHERTERREGEPGVFPTCGQHDRGITRVKVGGVEEMRVCDRGMQFG